MLVSGPVGTKMISSVAFRYVSIRNSTAEPSAGAEVACGMSR